MRDAAFEVPLSEQSERMGVPISAKFLFPFEANAAFLVSLLTCGGISCLWSHRFGSRVRRIHRLLQEHSCFSKTRLSLVSIYFQRGFLVRSGAPVCSLCRDLVWAITVSKVIQPWSDLENKIKAGGGCSGCSRRISRAQDAIVRSLL